METRTSKPTAGPPAPTVTWTCPTCHQEYQLREGAAPPDLCPDCEAKFTIKRREMRDEGPARQLAPTSPSIVEIEADEAAAAVILTMAPTIPGHRITDTLEIVTAECVYGVNAWKEFLAGFTDVFGGRSIKLQQVLRELRKTCLAELKAEAAAAGGNAVISVTLSYNEIGGKGMSMLMLVASGTAVHVSADHNIE